MLGYAKRRLIENIITEHWGGGKKEFSFNDLLFVMQETFSLEGRPYLEGDYSINRGYDAYKAFVSHLLYRNIANYDSMLLLTGEKGSGKSSAAMIIAKAWCNLIGIRFEPARHIAYSNGEMKAKIDGLKPFEPLIGDEAVRFISAADWARRENKELKKRFGEIRTKHLLFLMCFPQKIYRVEKTYLNSYVNYWIDVFARGRGAVFIKDRNPVTDAWRLDDFKKMGKYNEFTDEQKIADVLKKHPGFWTLLRFPKPSEALYAKYLKIRERNIYDEESVWSTVTREDIYRSLLILTLRDIMAHDSTLTMNRVMLHIKSEYDIKLPKAVVSSIVDDAQQLVMKVKEQSALLEGGGAILADEVAVAESGAEEPEEVAEEHEEVAEDGGDAGDS